MSSRAETEFFLRNARMINYFQVCFLENFEMVTSVFYSIIRNFRPGGVAFLPCKLCIFTEHGVVF